MRSTTKHKASTVLMTTDTSGLMAALTCGRSTAVKIGTQAGARIQIGSRVLWNMQKVQDHLNHISQSNKEGITK